MEVAIIDYGAGNVQSVAFALERIGYKSIITNNKETIENAKYVIFPGVGEASYAMQQLNKSGLDVLIPTLKQPVLGICLGMQLLCNSTQEGNTQGLGVFDIDVIKFQKEVKIPQMGWNTINQLKSKLFNSISENEYVYLVHSYYVPINENASSVTNYGIEYATSLVKDNFYGVQFHPEKSGKTGETVLKNFLNL